ncbi:hypothetical protein F5Y05DRAFT_378903 [Hypoxylon sp. FL0543]|nr:hypothetical protein F5Y05DRAFT_378903 [Hypoxylon sp. FL0543]
MSYSVPQAMQLYGENLLTGIFETMSRHMACKLCRDRKVRCDGGQPSCDKCRRSGDKCVYAPTSIPTRADMAQIIENLQGRLARAEAQLSVQPDGTGPGSGRTNSSSSSILEDYSTLDFQYQLPSISPWTSLPQNTMSFPDLTQHDHDPSGTDNDFLRLTYGDDTRSTQNPSQMPESSPIISPRSPMLPNLDSLRALNQGSMPSSSLIPATPYNMDGDSKQTLDLFADLLSEIFVTQADISGLSYAVAEYLSWARKTPGTGEISLILETLETRVRELNHIASTRHWAAFKHMCASAAKMHSLQIQLRRIEMDLTGKTMKAMELFHGNYDISSPLSEQR